MEGARNVWVQGHMSGIPVSSSKKTQSARVNERRDQGNTKRILHRLESGCPATKLTNFKVDEENLEVTVTEDGMPSADMQYE